jgi:hypothetical protein
VNSRDQLVKVLRRFNELKGYREFREAADMLESDGQQIDALRAQLLAARAEALEWAYDNTGLDMSFSSRHRDKAHFVRDGLAALRAKGGGK